LAGGHRDDGIIGMFACYLDDSDSKLSSVTTMAGYLARVSAWREFEKEVEPVFNNYGVEILHTKELHDTKGCFENWTRIKKETFIGEIYAIANKYVSLAISVSARKNSVQRMRKESRKNSGVSAYGVCFNSIVFSVVRHKSLRDEIKRDGVSFIVESGHVNNGELERFFHKQKKHPLYTDVIRSLKFVGKEDSRAIQIADFFAFHSRRCEAASDCFDGKLSLPVHQIYSVAGRHLTHCHMTLRGKARKVSDEEVMKF
jgi:hypothetical protein